MPKEESLEERLKNAEKTASQITDKKLKSEINKEIAGIRKELNKYGSLESQKAKLEAEKGDLAKRCRELEKKLKANPGKASNNPGNITYKQYYDVGRQAYKAWLYDKAIDELKMSISIKPTDDAIILLRKSYICGNKVSDGLDYFKGKLHVAGSSSKFMEAFKYLIWKVYKEKKSNPSTPKALLKKALDHCEQQLKSAGVSEIDKSYFRKYFKKIGRLYKNAR